MGRMPHLKSDARDIAHSQVNVRLRMISRRLKADAEDYISVIYDECMLQGVAFDAEAVAMQAIEQALANYRGIVGSARADRTIEA